MATEERAQPDSTELMTALRTLRDALAGARYPLGVPGAAEAERSAHEFAGQLGDYVVPRLRHPSAPLLVVVGGSTGAGKSTLVNSLVRRTVSPAGVLRPTTRSPVLVCHPRDVEWFASPGVLPDFTRGHGTDDHHTLRIVESAQLTAGLAFMDAPDVDSVVDENRDIAAQLLAAADLWLYVTTAARYADALPWRLLATARQRGLGTAIVLNRVSPAAEQTVSRDLRDRLAAAGLAEPTLFVLPEVELDAGMLPEPTVASLQVWASGVAGSLDRGILARRTLDGVLASVGPRADVLASAAQVQTAAAEQLLAGLDAGYASAEDDVRAEIETGELLRGEVLARWQAYAGSGQLVRALGGPLGQLRNRIAGGLGQGPPRDTELRRALESALAQLVRSAAEQAAEEVAEAWAAYPAGATVLEAAGPRLTHRSPELDAEAGRLVREWSESLLAGVQHDLTLGPTSARTVRGAVATALVAAVAALGGDDRLPGGVEVPVGGETDPLIRDVPVDLDAIERIAVEARDDLLARIGTVLAAERARFGQAVEAMHVDPGLAERLREAERIAASTHARWSGVVSVRPIPGGSVEVPDSLPALVDPAMENPAMENPAVVDPAEEPEAGDSAPGDSAPGEGQGVAVQPLGPGQSARQPEASGPGRSAAPAGSAPAATRDREQPEPSVPRVRRTVGRPRTDDGDPQARAEDSVPTAPPTQRGEHAALQADAPVMAAAPAGRDGIGAGHVPSRPPSSAGTSIPAPAVDPCPEGSVATASTEPDRDEGEYPYAGHVKNPATAGRRVRRVTATAQRVSGGSPEEAAR
ncbi:MAG: hypothetical protein QOD41_3022 [Cryptosporangiaceae bacterium]|nr:hypothetical protein [Cryptosporangiaceae bacterium]